MADGLSIAASVAGLIHVAEKVIRFISTMTDASSTTRSVLAEVHAFHAIFHQLQDFISNFSEGSEARKSRIYVDQVVTILAGCVCAFSELEKELETLKTDGSSSSGLNAWDSAKWARKYQNLGRILAELQRHKSSLNLMLSVYTWYITTYIS